MSVDLLLRRAHLVTMAEPGGYGIVRDGAIAIDGETIAWAGREAEMPAGLDARTVIDAGGRWITPGLVDCHTHLVYAGQRANEFERRLHGASYADIAREGGGIMSTVRATRAASAETLVAQSEPRLRALAAEGVTTIEIKSGYGLDVDSELRMLEVARRLGERCDVDVRTTLLAAHALPPEYAGRADDYIELVCRTIIPLAAQRRLADAVDAFCETIAFTPEQTRRVFECARLHGLPVKLHADQLSDGGGAALVASFDGLSADHVEHTSREGIAAMARAGTVAVLLPGAFYTLRETRLPPVDALRADGVPIAISTDCNPGTSPVTSLLLMINMACTLFRLTFEEALAGATCNAARALGLRDRGRLVAGARADLACFDIAEPAELAYRVGGNPCAGIVRRGHLVRWDA